MNDTNLNGRQKKILSILKEVGSVSRLALTSHVSSDATVSRITFIRDLNRLIKLHLIKVSGKGKSTIYKLVEKNSLLTYLDLERYFKTEAETRIINKYFNNDVFSRLNNLYSSDEIKLWERGKEAFKNAGDKLNPSIYERELERFMIGLSYFR